MSLLQTEEERRWRSICALSKWLSDDFRSIAAHPVDIGNKDAVEGVILIGVRTDRISVWLRLVQVMRDYAT